MDVTRYMDLGFKPTPKRYPLPPGSVAYLEGLIGDVGVGSTYVICKNKQEIVIEGPPLEEPFIENSYEKILWTMKMHAKYLAVIEDLLPTIEFGTTNWAYLVPDQYEGYRIMYAQKTFARVSCPTWTTTIHINEIECTGWGCGSQRRGLWKGKNVDIVCAWNERDFWRVNRAMHGLRRVDGQDLTFELYGHLVDDDGRIVGYVSEAAWGRHIGLGDEQLVQEGLKRLEDLGCLYKACYCNQFLIAGGRLRLLEPCGICYYSDPTQLKRDAEWIHHAMLDDLFDEFKEYGRFGFYKIPPILMMDWGITYLRLNTIPRYSLHQSYLGSTRNFIDDDDIEEQGRPKTKTVPQLLDIYRRKRPLLLEYSNRSAIDKQGEGRPLRSMKPKLYSLLGAPYPYQRPPRVLKKLTDTDSSQGTLDTNGE